MFIVECERDKWAFESGVNGSIKTPIDHSEVKEKAPYQVGDKLWVRETFQALEYVGCTGLYDEYEGSLVEANWMGGEAKDVCDIFYKADEENGAIDKWRPSVHMPQWAARLFPEITNVRVERLQDISVDDAISEGITLDEHDVTCMGDCANRSCNKIGERTLCDIYHTDEDCPETEAFGMLWDSIYKNWDKNPWVWVIEFKENKK